MATGKAEEGAVSYRENPGDTVSIGVTVGGSFVPFVTLEGAYVRSLAEAAKSPEAKAASGETDEGSR